MMEKAITMMIVGMAMGAWAANITIDGVEYHCGLYDGYNPKRAIITKIVTDKKSVTIPETLNGYAAYRIDDEAMLNNTTVMKIILPETVKEIGRAAFSGCVALTTCNIPSGLTEIPVSCFYGCTKLRRIVLPSGIKSIGGAAFENCSSLEDVVFPVGLETIGVFAFGYCSHLTVADLPDTVTSLGYQGFYYCKNLEIVHLPAGLKSIPFACFGDCPKLRIVNIPDGVVSIDVSAFSYCASLQEVTIPASVTSVGVSAFHQVGCVIFLGRPPAGLVDALSMSSAVVYPKEYGELWAAQLPIAQAGGFVKPTKPVVTIISAAVRRNDPTVLDVVYKVASSKPTVKVRALAFEDGIRSLANVTRPETFIDDTATNIGDAVTANVEHTLSWKVSSDFHTDLAKMKFEVLAVEDGILPLELTTIPTNGTNRAMELSWNLLTEAQVFDALLWLYADGDSGLTLADGVLTNGSTWLANGTSIMVANAVQYAFTKMGFSLLTGDALTYANEMTRFGLAPSGIRQYAYRWIEAQ